MTNSKAIRIRTIREIAGAIRTIRDIADANNASVQIFEREGYQPDQDHWQVIVRAKSVSGTFGPTLKSFEKRSVKGIVGQIEKFFADRQL